MLATGGIVGDGTTEQLIEHGRQRLWQQAGQHRRTNLGSLPALQHGVLTAGGLDLGEDLAGRLPAKVGRVERLLQLVERVAAAPVLGLGAAERATPPDGYDDYLAMALRIEARVHREIVNGG